jgi:hypothetical protein
MEKKERITVYLPQKLYIEIFDRHLEHQFSYLVALLVEEFIRATDARIIWAEMPSKAAQREYIERKVRELFSRPGVSMQGRAKQSELSAEPPRPPTQEALQRPKPPAEPSKPFVQEPPQGVYTPPKPKPVKQETSPEDDWDNDILRRIESLW